MMINCPNCKLLQPKDQYCAQCGVNMETWKPPEAPLWKKLLGNWMVQLGLLFLLILGVVMWDSVSNRTAKPESSLPPVADEFERSRSFTRSKQESITTEAKESLKSKKSARADSKIESQTTSLNIQKAKTTPFEQKIKLSIAAIRLGVIEGLLQNTLALDENIFLLGGNKKFLTQSRKSISSYGSTLEKRFEFGNTVNLFFGEQDQISEKNLGFFLQANITEGSDSETVSVELRFWQQFTSSEDVGETTSSYFSVPKKTQYLLIVAPYAGSRDFSREDLSLFESSAKLKGLANEAFLDGSTEFAYLIQIK